MLTGGGHSGEHPDGVEALGNVWLDELVRSTGARPRSSSPRSTRASGCRRSRRWPAAARSPARTPRRCPRCAATRRGTSRRRTPEEIAAAVAEVLADPGTVGRARARAGSRVHVGALGAGSTRTSTASSWPRSLRAMCGICGILAPRRGRSGARRGDERRDRPPRPRPRRGRPLRPVRARLPPALDHRPRRPATSRSRTRTARSSRSSTARSTTSASSGASSRRRGTRSAAPATRR